MLHASELRADRYREIARELRCLAFKRTPFDLCRQAQMIALAEGFEKFADRIEVPDR
jgi:hypothetical protein